MEEAWEGLRQALSAFAGREIAVADTRKGATPGEIVHLLGEGADRSGLEPGVEVTACIDAARRRAHMRFHTATHLLCALVPHAVDGCSITQRYARLDFIADTRVVPARLGGDAGLVGAAALLRA